MHTGTVKPLRLRDLFKSEPRPAPGVEMMVCLEQQKFLMSQGTIFALSTIFISTVSAYIYAKNSPLWLVLLWYMPLVVYSAFQFMTSKRSRRRTPPTFTTGKLMRMAEYGCIFLGMMYGSTYFLFFSDNTTANFFNIALVSGFCASLTGLMSSYPRQVCRFICFAGIPMWLSMTAIDLGWTHHTPTKNVYQWVFLLPIVAGLAGFFRCVLLNHERMVNSIVAREKSKASEQMLREALNTYNDAFAIFDPDGKRVMCNSHHEELIGDVETSCLNAEAEKEIKIHNLWFNRRKSTMSNGLTVLSHSDITVLKIRERELVAAQKEAVEADSAKSRFLSTMSHELRSPLNVILGFSRLMASDSKIDLSGNDVAEYADSIHDSGSHLLHIINDIIDYTKVGFDKLEIDTSTIDIRELINRSANLAIAFDDAFSDVTINLSISPKVSEILADPVLSQRILTGLISNALRFSDPKDGKITIKVGLSDDQQVFIAVRDFGQGIPEKEIERVFEAFYQIDGEKNRSHGGTGLGLTLCRHLARLQGGDIILKSRVGAGTNAVMMFAQNAHVPGKSKPSSLTKTETKAA